MAKEGAHIKSKIRIEKYDENMILSSVLESEDNGEVGDGVGSSAVVGDKENIKDFKKSKRKK